MKLFFGSSGAPKKAPQSSIKDSVLMIRENIEMLEKREKHMQTKIDKELAEARANAQKNKRVALMALKRKKQYELQIEKMMQTRMNLEYQLNHIDNAAMDRTTLEAMRAGNDALRTLHAGMSIDKVDELMDDVQEQISLSNEISNVVSTALPGLEVDDDELNRELEELEQEELDSKLLEVDARDTAPAMPNVPTAEPVIKPKKVAAAAAAAYDEEAELAQLKAEMAM